MAWNSKTLARAFQQLLLDGSKGNGKGKGKSSKQETSAAADQKKKLTPAERYKKLQETVKNDPSSRSKPEFLCAACKITTWSTKDSCRECKQSKGWYMPACCTSMPTGKPKPWSELKQELSQDPPLQKTIPLANLQEQTLTWAQLVAAKDNTHTKPSAGQDEAMETAPAVPGTTNPLQDLTIAQLQQEETKLGKLVLQLTELPAAKTEVMNKLQA
eukprot:6457873-Amphidinium_carterae.1